METHGERLQRIARKAAEVLYPVVNWKNLIPEHRWVVLNPWGNSTAHGATQEKAEAKAESLRTKHREVILAALREAALTPPPVPTPLSEKRLVEIREDLEARREDHDWAKKQHSHHRRLGYVGSCELCLVFDLFDHAEVCHRIIDDVATDGPSKVMLRLEYERGRRERADERFAAIIAKARAMVEEDRQNGETAPPGTLLAWLESAWKAEQEDATS